MTASAASVPAKKKPRKPLSLKKIGIIGGLLLVLLIVYWGTQPLTGSINFGICKIFVEQNVRYPHEIRYISLIEQPGQARIEYVVLNEFGSYESKTITHWDRLKRCRYQPGNHPARKD
jgi:hypothetical protein